MRIEIFVQITPSFISKSRLTLILETMKNILLVKPSMWKYYCIRLVDHKYRSRVCVNVRGSTDETKKVMQLLSLRQWWVHYLDMKVCLLIPPPFYGLLKKKSYNRVLFSKSRSNDISNMKFESSVQKFYRKKKFQALCVNT